MPAITFKGHVGFISDQKFHLVFFTVLDALSHPIPCCASVTCLQNFYLIPVDDLSEDSVKAISFTF